MNTIHVVPAIAQQAIAQFTTTGLLEPRPPLPAHGFGAAAPGCVSFPECWSTDVIARRTDDMLAGERQPLWYSIYGRRIFYRRYDDLWLMVLTHSAGTLGELEPAQHVIAVFPHDSGPAISPSRHRIAPLYAAVFAQAVQAFDDLHNEEATEFHKVAGWLRDSGLIAEALVWLMLCQAHFPALFGEDTWVALHAMAVDGLFDDCPGFDALTLIETQWALDYPATWGLASDARSHSEPIAVERSLLPDADQIVRGARRWLEAALPSHLRSHPETEVTTGRRTNGKFTVVLTLPSGHATLEALGVVDGRSEGLAVLTIEHTAHPCDRLAGLILALAISELLGGDRGYIAFPELFAAVIHTPDLLQSETSRLDLRRLVLLDPHDHRR